MAKVGKHLYLLVGFLLLVSGAMIALRRMARSGEQRVPADIQRDWQQIRQEGILRILMPYQPQADRNQMTDTMSSEYYRMADWIKKRSGLKTEILIGNKWGKASQLLCEGRIDLALLPHEQTAVTDTVHFAFIPMQESGRIYLVQRRADSAQLIREQFQLVGDTVVIPQNKTWQLLLEHLAEEIGGYITVKTDARYESEQLAILVQKGLISHTVCTEGQRKYFESAMPELDCSLPLSYDLTFGWAVRKTSVELQDSLRLWLSH